MSGIYNSTSKSQEERKKMAVSAREALLGDTFYGAVDYKGCPVSRSITGGWRSASFIIGAFVADSYLGRYRTILFSFILYILEESWKMAVSEREALLGDTVYGALDYKGYPVSRSTTGGWRSASFIIGVEMAERFVYHSIASNLISYLTGPLQQPTAGAAANGSGMLTLSATLSSLRPPDCDIKTSSMSSCPSPTRFQVVFFFMSLYVAALAVGGNKPCAQAFGADQFDPYDPKESKSRSSFFNWWYFGLCFSNVVSLCIVNYIQDDLSWGLGFGVPCISMMVAMVVFFLGSKTYRYCLMEEKNPFMSILEVLVAAAHSGRGPSSSTNKNILLPIDYEPKEAPVHGSSTQFKFLGRAVATENLDSLKQDWSVCTMSQVEDAKMVLGLLPIWATCLIYGVIITQQSTFFTKQGSTMERGIGSGFQIPPATLQIFIYLTVLAVIPIYDRVLVPATRAITGLPPGITVLQRIGIGMFLSVVSMVVAAVVEAQRLKVARDAGLMDKPAATVPMSVWWLIPQYALFGVVEVFSLVGLQELFYDQVPDTMRSVGMALFLSIFGTGNFIGGFLISVIAKIFNLERRRGRRWEVSATEAMLGDTVDAAVDYKGRPVTRSTAGGWRSASFIIGVEMAESLLGAFVADLYLGRYWTILFSFLLYILGLGMLTLSATLRSLRPPDCDIKTLSTSSCPSLTRFQVVFFFLSLYAAALALGGLKPCAQAFRADQFDPRDPKESKSKSSFFNWCTTQWARPIFHHR
ncbi:hypothetical protein AAC387_Pa01g3833 [Persea americana]